MNNDSYNDYIRSVLGNTSNDDSLRYPDEDKSYYCDYSHPKNNMQMYENQNNMANNNMQVYDTQRDARNDALNSKLYARL